MTVEDTTHQFEEPHHPHDWPREYRAFFDLFNHGDYFEAHEVLEDLWAIEVAPLKNYYKGLIQAAVAICHWERGNVSGAWRLWKTAREYLRPYPTRYEGFDLGGFREGVDRLFIPLRDNIHVSPSIDKSLIPHLHLDATDFVRK
ncbi:DUF309 domain-containing protein [Candidatus Sumerlaeota bacterium]|nr:DUF309 domain-containing protein [Candidatus Sumerlaeota bacterium]